METVDVQQLLEKADRLYQEAELDDALAAYEEIVAVAPEDAWAHSRIGAIMAQWEQLDEAEAALKLAIELDPRLASAHSNLGNIYYARGDYKGALQKYEEAIAINPENSVFYQNLHAANKKLGNLTAAVAALKRSHKIERQVVKEQAKAQFSETNQRIKRRLGCLPASILMIILLLTFGTAALL